MWMIWIQWSTLIRWGIIRNFSLIIISIKLWIELKCKLCSRNSWRSWRKRRRWSREGSIFRIIFRLWIRLSRCFRCRIIAELPRWAMEWGFRRNLKCQLGFSSEKNKLFVLEIKKNYFVMYIFFFIYIKLYLKISIKKKYFIFNRKINKNIQIKWRNCRIFSRII